MRPASRDFLIGLVTIAACLGLAVLLIRFGEMELFRTDRYRITIQTDRSGGLRPGSPVELHGIPVGIVEAIQLSGTPDHPVNLLLRINRDVQIMYPVRPFVQASVLGGTSILELVPDARADGLLAQDGTSVVTAPLRSRLLDDTVQTLEMFTAPLLTAAKQFEELSATYIEVGESIRELIHGTADDPDHPSVQTVLARLDTTLTETRRTASLMNDWLGDDQLQSDIRTVVRNADAALQSAGETFESHRLLADNLGRHADELVPGFLRTGDAIAETLAELQTVSRRMTEGPGTVARLLNDPDLHLSLLDAANRLDLVLQEMQLLIEKSRAEGLRIGF